MLEAFIAQKDALLAVEGELRKIEETNKRPPEISQSKWTTLKNVAKNTKSLNREDFGLLKELCKVLKVFHKETCRVSV